MDLDKMSHFESKVGTLQAPQEMIYNFLSDFSNLEQMVPPDKVKDFSCTTDSCRFTVDNVGELAIRIMERTPYKTIKITSDGKAPFEFYFWIQLVSVDDYTTKIRLTVKAALNTMMKMMVKKPLKTGLDKIIDQLETAFKK